MERLLRYFYLLDLASLPLALRGDRLYRQMPQLPATPVTRNLPALSIIIPARNEVHNLRRTMPNLTALQYPGDCEIILVDDNSSDGTAEFAQSFGVDILHLQDLPVDWLGKPHACHHGAQLASGEWLLFTDADVMHYPHGPANAVLYCLEKGLDGISLFLGHPCASWIERVTLMVAYAGLFASLRNLDGFLNGQYILMKRSVYRASNGFSAVRKEKLEDLALGTHLYRNGYHLELLRGTDVASVQMYSQGKELWHGMSRLGTGTMRWLGWRAIIPAIFTTTVISPLIYSFIQRKTYQPRRWSQFTWGLTSVGLIPWARRAGSGWFALLGPIGAVPLLGAALWGLLQQVLRRGVTWKDRKV